MSELPYSDKLPGSVLFACTHNSIRSVMAENIMKSLYGHAVYVDSAGVMAKDVDPFAVEVLDEIGLDASKHVAKNFDDLADNSFDMIISLSVEAHHKAEDMTRATATDTELWNIIDPSGTEGNREMRLNAYRHVRDDLYEKIKARFRTAPAPRV
ncbi:MAG: low molecular weight phosphatase family protein [Sneathiella sp.]|jgi:protein-tyrosine-phosphatase|uniref:arsenate reductase ArsC n=1 Tax=Sneathiella sp. TaxID=1964365 RepID=UPI000C451067|nr:arsenate reductase ArsC [Sneathiella sp.]MAL80623.1 low molecular weight phosphatase family protein [Sneathiella sp.]|tara:strand:+ start:855 stop:1316 length:462 start_codon:yes stop_codon:yes gene_type:complete